MNDVLQAIKEFEIIYCTSITGRSLLFIEHLLYSSKMKCLISSIILLLLNSVECSVNSIQIVSPEGISKSTAQLNNFLSSSESIKATCPVVGLIDCGNPNSNKLLETILGTSETTISNGMDERRYL